MVNLLIHLGSFSWRDRTIDRSRILEDINSVISKIKENNGSIYNHPNSFNFNLGWGYFHELMSYCEDQRRNLTPWLSYDHQKILIKLFNHSHSNKPSYFIDDLNIEFANENNGLIGCNLAVDFNHYVYNIDSWKTLNSLYVSGFNIEERKAQYEYFKAYYIPTLTISLNQINELIQQGHAHNTIIRLDPGLIQDEKIHIHFDDGSALNIDGTWKHSTRNIPIDACNQLQEWGFVLPEQYYVA